MAKITFEDKVALNPQPSVAEKNKCTDANINEIKTCVNDNCTYSSSEVCVGEWIDGKPLYRKVIEDTTPTTTDGNLANKSVPINVSNVSFIYIDKALIVGSSTYNCNTLVSTMSFSYGVRFEVNATNVVIYSNSGVWSNLPVKIVIEYTKTTD